MIRYHIALALRSLWISWPLTVLMVLLIAFGVACSTTILNVIGNLSGNPVPNKSGLLFHPQIDPRPLSVEGLNPPDNLTYTDAKNLYELTSSYPRSISSANWLPAYTGADSSKKRMYTVRATTSQFFSMFGAPFRYGAPWSEHQDKTRERVIVLSEALNNLLFGGQNSVGSEVTIATKVFRVVGVLKDWDPKPKFYDISGGAYANSEQMYMPFFSWIDLPQDYGYGKMVCWGNDANKGVHNPKSNECTWVNLWVELDAKEALYNYKAMLRNYSAEQHEHGRFEKGENVRLMSVAEWLGYNQYLPAVVRMQLLVSFLVLSVCIINNISLMIAKFEYLSLEMALRRALGAPRSWVIRQHLIEASVVGCLGGLVSLPLVWLGLAIFRNLKASYSQDIHFQLWSMIVALAIAVLSALASAIYPSLRMSRVLPTFEALSA